MRETGGGSQKGSGAVGGGAIVVKGRSVVVEGRGSQWVDVYSCAQCTGAPGTRVGGKKA